ncbi:MAG: YhcH/YjgK/YiaL family protein [Clostridia bacterium]|nr:YhcH/YjgK/YiaL family protein [Clostridia bacterium]
MIYGNIHNEFFEQQAAVLPKPLCEALHFLKDADLVGHETGAFPMELGGVSMILQVMDLETSPRDTHYPEIHRKYVDLQLFVSGGPEVATFFTDRGEETIRENLLDSPRDIVFYENRPETAGLEGCVIMHPGDYAIYFPWDVHVPGQSDANGPKNYRKIVLKVPMAACL